VSSFNFFDLNADEQRIAARAIVFEAGGDADDPLEVQLAIEASLAASVPRTGAETLRRIKQATDVSDMTLAGVFGVARATMNLYTTGTREIDLLPSDKAVLRAFLADRLVRIKTLLGVL